MTKRHGLSAAAVALAITAASLPAASFAQSVPVFESFPNFATAGATNLNSCSSCTGYGVLAASFTLTSDQVLDRAFVLINPLTDPANNSFTVSIIADNGSDLPLGGDSSFAPLYFMDYTLPTSLTPEPGGTVLAEMDLPDWNVGAGKYWIRFAGYSMTMPIYHTDDPAHSRVVGTQFFNGGGITRNAPDEAIGFSLNAVAAVPEPATYAMLMAGLVGVGFVARRRRAS